MFKLGLEDMLLGLLWTLLFLACLMLPLLVFVLFPDTFQIVPGSCRSRLCDSALFSAHRLLS